MKFFNKLSLRATGALAAASLASLLAMCQTQLGNKVHFILPERYMRIEWYEDDKPAIDRLFMSLALLLRGRHFGSGSFRTFIKSISGIHGRFHP